MNGMSAPFCVSDGGTVGLIYECLQLQEMANNAAKYAQFWIRRAKQAAWQGKTPMRINLGFCSLLLVLLL